MERPRTPNPRRGHLDEKYLEFLGNFLLSAAKGRKQMDELMCMSRMGFKGFEEMASMFRKFYGLDKIEKGGPEYVQNWDKAAEEFRNSFKEYLDIMGVVPKKDYVELVGKYEELKKKVADQEETIRHLQILMKNKGADQGETARIFQDMMKKQGEQFVEIMDAVGGYFKKESDESKNEKK
jgi:hypothetical protein